MKGVGSPMKIQMVRPLLAVDTHPGGRGIAWLLGVSMLFPDIALLMMLVFHAFVFPVWMRRLMRRWRAMLP